jgi:NADH-quinone oxidoreductase subunit J
VTFETSYLLYVIFALGAAAVLLLLPRSQRSLSMAGELLGLAALAALVVTLAMRVAPPGMNVPFYVFAILALIAASRVITHPRPVYSAVYLIVVVICVAAMVLLTGAEFLAVALVIVYAGAILVTYVFVIMLAQQAGSPAYDRRAREPLAATFVGFLLMAALAGQLVHRPARAESSEDGASGTKVVPVFQLLDGESPDFVDVPAYAEAPSHEAGPVQSNTRNVGLVVATKYVVALELAGVLLLVAMIGAIALSKKRVPSDQVTRPRELGRVGKEVEPF